MLVTKPEAFEFTEAPPLPTEGYVAEVPAGLTSSEELLEALYRALELPGYFGFNWNALSDCLRDFHWLPQRCIVLWHAGLPAIPSAELRIYLDVLAEAVASWRPEEEHALRVIFPLAARSEVFRVWSPSH